MGPTINPRKAASSFHSFIHPFPQCGTHSFMAS